MHLPLFLFLIVVQLEFQDADASGTRPVGEDQGSLKSIKLEISLSLFNLIIK